MTAAEIAAKCGWIDSPRDVDAVLRRMASPLFAQAAANQAPAPDEDVYLWDAARAVTGAHLPAHDQDGVGCCVGEGFASAVEYLQCVEIALGSEPEEYRPIASEAIYALSRVEIGGGRVTGDGSVGAWAARAVREFGVVPRGVVGRYDLSRFDPARARDWGRRGLPGDLEPIARRHPVRSIGLVRRFDEARAALASGYPVVVCSPQGFTLTRDADGFCSPRGRWPHCMCFIGATVGRRPGLCCLQSWGPHLPGGPIGLGDHPSCAFWVDADVADRMLAAGDSWALSAFDGFPARAQHWAVIPQRRFASPRARGRWHSSPPAA
jgi:hypothetical protein